MKERTFLNSRGQYSFFDLDSSEEGFWFHPKDNITARIFRSKKGTWIQFEEEKNSYNTIISVRYFSIEREKTIQALVQSESFNLLKKYYYDDYLKLEE